MAHEGDGEREGPAHSPGRSTPQAPMRSGYCVVMV